MTSRIQHDRHRVLVPLMLAAALLSSACVTINIYFPAAAAEKAADRIIDEVWDLSGAKPSGGAAAQQEDAE